MIITGETRADWSDAGYDGIHTGAEATIRVPPGAVLVGQARVRLAAWNWGRLSTFQTAFSFHLHWVVTFQHLHAGNVSTSYLAVLAPTLGAVHHSPALALLVGLIFESTDWSGLWASRAAIAVFQDWGHLAIKSRAGLEFTRDASSITDTRRTFLKRKPRAIGVDCALVGAEFGSLITRWAAGSFQDDWDVTRGQIAGHHVASHSQILTTSACLAGRGVVGLAHGVLLSVDFTETRLNTGTATLAVP